MQAPAQMINNISCFNALKRDFIPYLEKLFSTQIGIHSICVKIVDKYRNGPNRQDGGRIEHVRTIIKTVNFLHLILTSAQTHWSSYMQLKDRKRASFFSC